MLPRRDSPWPSRCDTVAVCQPETWRFEMSASWLRLFGLMIVSAWLAIGCSGPSKIEVGGTCVMNSDCNQGLVCTWGKCHAACHTSADCPAGESCITASDQSTVCQLPVETHCIYDSDCSIPLKCAADQRCHNQCQTNVDCPTGQSCTTTKACAEPNQVDLNNNLIAADGGVSASGGASGTDAAASCLAGAEGCSCYANATCNTGLTCASNLCVKFSAGGGAGGTAGDARATGGSTGTGGVAPTGGTDAGTVIETGGMGGAAGGTTSPDGGCPAGSETCACYGNGTCNGGLLCLSNLCVRPLTGGAVGAGGTLGAGGAVNTGDAIGSGGASGTGGSRTNPDASPDLLADGPLAASGSDVVLGTGPDSRADTTSGTREAGVSAGSMGTNASLWSEITVPTSFCDWDSNSAEVGAHFWSDVDGSVVAVRFYKDLRNKSPHSGRLWTDAGVLLAEVPFVSETDSGWQEAAFSAPIPIVAGTRYVVSFHSTTGYSYDPWVNVDSAPLHADGAYYCYGDPPCFPSSYYGVNYWVDVVFSTALIAVPPDSGAKEVSSPDLAVASSVDAFVAASGSEVGVGTGPDSGAGGAAGTGGSGGSTGTNASLWDDTAVPSSFCNWDPGPVEIGTEFWSDIPGNVVAVRFYKDPLNTGLHSGRLWTAAGALLAEVTFTAETASGWQEAPFAAAVPVTAGARYVVSFHSTTGYSYDNWSNVDRAPLHADAGYYCYGEPPCLPSGVGDNYWVDAVFSQ